MQSVLLPDGQPVTQEGLAHLGEALLRLVAVSVSMGHVSAANSLSYVAAPADDDGILQFVLDAFGACIPDRRQASAHRDRLRAYVESSGLLDLVAESVVRDGSLVSNESAHGCLSE